MAAFTLFRFFRFLRSMCMPLTAIIGFSCLLTFIFILYQPTHGPGEIQRLGWQSWESVSGTTGAIDDTGSSSTGTAGGAGENEDVDTGVDWWNVSQPDAGQVDTTSFPLDVWNPFLPHDTGISEIAITRCMIDPVFAGEMCAPSSTVEQDAIKGKWVLVERNLNRQSGMWYLDIYYRRTRRLDIPLITELRLLPNGQEPSPMNSSWHKVDRSIRDGVPRTDPLYLWYRTGQSLREINVNGKDEEYITEIDVLYGEDRQWYGFEKLEPPVMQEQPHRRERIHVTYRRGVKPVPKTPPLHFSRDGRFKILQVADLHYSVSRGDCRDVRFIPCNNSDNLTTTLLSRILDAEKPDMVVFSGDQLNGQGTSWDPKSVLAKFSQAVEERHIPWAAVFGNHDAENGEGREQQLKMMQNLPYSMVEPGPKDIHGVGNYVLKVKSADASKTHLLTLYFLDSGSYAKGYLDFWGFFTPTEYDYIHQDQIDWFLQESGSIEPIERPFKPDTNQDFGHSWKRQADQNTGTNYRLAKPNAIMFFHIPLQESYHWPDKDTYTGSPLDKGLHDMEPIGSAKQNEGFFEKGILRAYETDHRAGGNVTEVKVIGNGHCHVTENCRRIKGVWLCFGGGGSYSGYGRIGFDRRFRIYDISDYGETIRTYKRTEADLVLDNMVLSGAGAPPPYEEHH